ncbi:MAG: hypothetical protein K6E12_06730 [Saccharofermentans sp.]|nr:hypothetical protein [Saccharofermentans sp.]
MVTVKDNSKMAFAGIAGAVTYAIADFFLYLGTNPLSESPLSVWQVPEWRLTVSMWIAVVGSLLLLLGYISLCKMYADVFGMIGKILCLPPMICFGGVLYMHFFIGVYAPLTYNSAVKAGVTTEQVSLMVSNAEYYLNPLTLTLIILGYSTEIVLLYGILSGKFGLKKRTAAFMFGGYLILALLFVLVAWITGEWGISCSLESLLETTFFIPAFLYWRKIEVAK